MKQERNNYAFIDSQNVNLAIRSQGWILDWKEFRRHLAENYGVTKTFLFIGYVSENKKLYDFLSVVGYTIIFKPTLRDGGGHTKGNVDAELVLHSMIEYNNYSQAVIVSGDGDFYCLIKYLHEQEKLLRLLIPDRHKYSKLLRQVLSVGAISFMNDLQKKLEYKGPARKRDQVGGST